MSMAPLRRFLLRLFNACGSRRAESDLDRELAAHLRLLEDDWRRRGLSLDDARLAARRSLGSVARVKDLHRDARSFASVDALRADLRYAWRMLRQAPGVTMVAALTLALGIGATTAIFSLAHAVLLRPLPFAEPERLAMLWEDYSAKGFAQNTPAPANYVDWRAETHTFQDMAATAWQPFNLNGAGEPERVIGLRVTANFFMLLGVKPVIGRLLEPADDGPEGGGVAVLSYGLWQRQFGGDSGLAGRRITLNGLPYTVVGVAPAGFQFPSKAADIWIAAAFTSRDLAQRGSHFLSVIGRLKSGSSLDQARVDMATIAHRLERQYPETNKDVGVAIVPLRDYYAGDLRLALRILLAAVGSLLLIACANVANLFLTRGATRHREIAVRVALGAGRGRVLQELLTECVVLSLFAGALGVALSVGAFRFLGRLIPERFPDGTALRLDLPVLAFAVGAAFATAMLFGAAPAIQALRVDVIDALKRGPGKGVTRLALGKPQGALVVVEVGLTVVLLVAAGLLVASYARIRAVDVGFRPEQVLTLDTPLPPAKYRDLQRRAEFYRQVLARTARLPGVISAAYVNFPPLTLKGGTSGFLIDGRPRPRPGERATANNRVATPDYFRTIGVSLLRGRSYGEYDGPDAPLVVVINATMARTYWPGEDALGAQIRFGDGGPDQPPYTVIGIVADVKQMGLDAPARPEMYFPATQASPGGSFFWPGTLVVHTAGDPRPLAPHIRQVVGSVDSEQPVADIRTMDDVLDREVSSRQLQTVILTALSLSALLLAIVGLYGVLSYAVSQHAREIGLRMALGAQRMDVIGATVFQALRLTVVGVLLGLAGSAAVTRVFSALLFQVSPSDPVTFGGVALLLFLTAILASLFPARGAASVDPAITLRHE
jgi:putative ABC transport system permease protein